MMTTPELFANECAADYAKYRALSAQHERGTLARTCYIKQSWLSRKYLRQWIAESSSDLTHALPVRASARYLSIELLPHILSA